MEVIILAAGEGERHPMRAKQLLVVGEETIIGRIIRQCEARGASTITYTKEIRIIRELDDLKADWQRPMRSRWIVETIISSSHLWGDRTCILLGDVIYSQSTMDAIFSNAQNFAWFGDEAESYALIFDRIWQRRVVLACERVVEKLYPSYQGTIRQLVHEIRGTTDKTIFKKTFAQRVHDWTRDIDTPDDWKKFQAEVIKRHKLDDKR